MFTLVVDICVVFGGFVNVDGIVVGVCVEEEYGREATEPFERTNIHHCTISHNENKSNGN